MSSLLKALDFAVKQSLIIRNARMQEGLYKGSLEEVSFYIRETRNKIEASILKDGITSFFLDVVVPVNGFLYILRRLLEEEAVYEFINSDFSSYQLELENLLNKSFLGDVDLEEEFIKGCGYSPLTLLYKSERGHFSIVTFFDTVQKEVLEALEGVDGTDSPSE